MGVGQNDSLLDVATGQGTSAVLAAEEQRCRVVASDLSAANLERAAAEASRRGVADHLSVQRSDAENLPFEDDSFDVVLCECAFCTFVDKPTAAREMVRVLRPGGRLALSDMTLKVQDFPRDLDTLLMRVACIADALSQEQLVDQLEQVGFGEIEVVDASWALTEMVQQIRQRILAAELLSKLGKVSLGGIDLAEGKRLANRSLEIIGDGIVGYVMLTGKLKKDNNGPL